MIKIRVFIVVYISTDNCTYHDTIYCDAFATEKEAKDYIDSKTQPSDYYPLGDNKYNYEIRSVILTNPTFSD